LSSIEAIGRVLYWRHIPQGYLQVRTLPY